MEMQWLRRQLGESQAQLMATVMGALPSGGLKEDSNSPHLVRPPTTAAPGLPITVESPENEETKRRRLRMEKVHAARDAVIAEDRERSPRRDGSNSLDSRETRQVS